MPSMRKTYKPMERAEQSAQVYRKKTLAVTDDFNIEKDANKLEDVDEYWDTAASVIGNRTIETMDDTVVTEQSDTLFNLKTIRQSIKGAEQPKKRLTLKVDDENMKVERPKYKLNTNTVPMDIPEPIKATEINEIEDSFADVPVPQFDVSNDIPFADGESETKENKNSGEDGKQMPKAVKLFKSGKSNVSQRTVSEVRKPVRQKQGSLEILDAKNVAVTNKVKALVCTDRMDTAVMSLDHMAYIKNEVAEREFSVFVLKGTVEVTVGGEKGIIKRGEVTVVPEGSVYSMNSVSRTGSLLFLSYVL